MVARVSDRRSFAALQADGRRSRSGAVWVKVVGQDRPARVAYAVPRTVGGAVVRNRVKRRLRAVVADLERHDQLGDGTFLVGVRPDAAELPYAALHDAVRHACTRLRP